MGIPNFIPSKIPINVPKLNDDDAPKFSVSILDRELDFTCLSVGNPHAVIIIDEKVEEFPLVEIGTIVEKHEYFPNRINFEVINIISRNKIRARIFERGAGETLSSGTGSTYLLLDQRWRRMPGGNGCCCEIHWRNNPTRLPYLRRSGAWTLSRTRATPRSRRH